MAGASLCSKMEENTKEITLRTRNTEKELTIGLMEDVIVENGKRENNMVWVTIYSQMEIRGWEDGLRGGEWNGWRE
jgi:hypothetical protein